MIGALEGLPGVEKVEADLGRDLFKVTCKKHHVPDSSAAMAEIKKLGYRPSPDSGTGFIGARLPPTASSRIPALMHKTLDKAKAEGKLAVVKCAASW